MRKKLFIIIIYINITIIFSFQVERIPYSLCLQKKPLNSQNNNLSCKIDSFYYALQYYIEDMPPIDYFINKIPIKKEMYFKKLTNNNYVIADPLEFCIGGINSQLARFSYKDELIIFTDNGYKKAIYNDENYLDANDIYKKYNKFVSFGIDIRLMLDTFKDYLKKNQILYKTFNLIDATYEEMVKVFIREILNGRVIICNGIISGYKNARVLTFSILGKNQYYEWKEAAHCFVVIGYDLNKKIFIVADNYGSMENPYSPVFREVLFKQLFLQISMINKNRLDYSFSIGDK